MLTALLVFASAQGAPVVPTVAFSAPKSVKAGACVPVTAKVTIPVGWHAYQNPPASEFENPLTLAFDKKSVFKVTGLAYPKGVAKTVGGVKTVIYEDAVTIRFDVTVPKGTKPGKVSVPMKLGYQLCSDATCRPPAELPLKLALTVAR